MSQTTMRYGRIEIIVMNADLIDINDMEIIYTIYSLILYLNVILQKLKQKKDSNNKSKSALHDIDT